MNELSSRWQIFRFLSCVSWCKVCLFKDIYLTWFSFSFGALVFFFKAERFSHYSRSTYAPKNILWCIIHAEENLKFTGESWMFRSISLGSWRKTGKWKVSYDLSNVSNKTGFTLRSFSEHFCWHKVLETVCIKCWLVHRHCVLKRVEKANNIPSTHPVMYDCLKSVLHLFKQSVGLQNVNDSDKNQ